MIKRILNRSRDLLFVPGTEKFWSNRLQGKVTMLVYHRVGSKDSQKWLDLGRVPRITAAELSSELGFLKELGAVFLTLGDLRAGRFPGDDEIGIVVSFDDGFRDSYEQGLPVIEAMGGRAVIFQCTAMLAHDCLLPEHRVYQVLYSGSLEQQQRKRLKLAEGLGLDHGNTHNVAHLKDAAVAQVSRNRLLEVLDDVEPGGFEEFNELYPSAIHLQEAVAAGHEVGSHGHWHSHRSTLTKTQFEQELRRSSALIEQVAGIRPAAFSFPFGAQSVGDREVCSRYFEQALTCERTRIDSATDPMSMGRFSWPGPPAPKGLRQRRWLLNGEM